jgi:hypothetical protein
MIELVLFRILERVIAVLIGGISIYLGYRLFHAVKAAGEGSAEVKLPGNVTVMVSRIAPGVFFALFGATVVGASVIYPVRYTETESQMVGGSSVRTKDISGIGGAPRFGTESRRETNEMERLRAREHIALLNQLPRLLDPTLSEAQRRRVHDNLLAAKLYLVQSVWAEDWGAYEDFRSWAEGGAKKGDSEAFRKAAEFFAYGQEGSR